MHFPVDRYCPTALLKWPQNLHAHTRLYCEKSPRPSKEMQSALNRLLSCCWCSSEAVVLGWASENTCFKLSTDILRQIHHTALLKNLYIAGVLVYICSRHLASYRGAKVCLGTENTKRPPPCLPRGRRALWPAEEEDTWGFSLLFLKQSLVDAETV